MAKGLDIGTGNLVGARLLGEDGYQYAPIRNIFLPIEKNPVILSMLKKENTPTVELDGIVYAIGDNALHLASAFNKPLHRPMQKGVINPHEAKALPIIKALVDNALRFGDGHFPGETVVFSVPASPVDASFNAVYHEGVFAKMLTSFGYIAKPLNEGLAVVYSELLDENLSGIGLSFGAGMVNVTCAVYGSELFSFSVATSGDFIDTNVSEALAITPVKALKAKEAMEDLMAPKDSTEQAIMFYYRHMLKHVVDMIDKHLRELDKLPEFDKAPSVAIAGGTSMPKGFVELFKSVLAETSLPIELGEIKRAEDPLKAIAKGCLYYAISLG